MLRTLTLAAMLVGFSLLHFPQGAAAAMPSAAWQQKRGDCINAARGTYMRDRGRGWRSRYNACMMGHKPHAI